MVAFPGHAPHNETVREMVRSDLNVTFCPQASSALRVPQKLYEYLRAGRPILALMGEGPGREILREFDAGVACNPLDPDEIGRVLVERFRQPRKISNRIERLESLERFERSKLTRDLAGLLETVVERQE